LPVILLTSQVFHPNVEILCASCRRRLHDTSSSSTWNPPPPPPPLPLPPRPQRNFFDCKLVSEQILLRSVRESRPADASENSLICSHLLKRHRNATSSPFTGHSCSRDIRGHCPDRLRCRGMKYQHVKYQHDLSSLLSESVCW
jgi:hypothetical protein